jgi:hypothetical protein
MMHDVRYVNKSEECGDKLPIAMGNMRFCIRERLPLSVLNFPIFHLRVDVK